MFKRIWINPLRRGTDSAERGERGGGGEGSQIVLVGLELPPRPTLACGAGGGMYLGTCPKKHPLFPHQILGGLHPPRAEM